MIFNRLTPKHSRGRAISHNEAKKYSLPHILLDWIEGNLIGVAILVVVIAILGITLYALARKDLVAYFYFNSCLGEWSNTSHAEGPPTVTKTGSPEQYNLNNSAVLSHNIGGLFCGDLYGSVPQASTPKKAELKLSLALIDEPDLVVDVDKTVLNENGQISSDVPSKGEGYFDTHDNTQKTLEQSAKNTIESVSHKKVSRDGDIFSGTIVDEEEPFIEIYFSYDDGKSWLLADTVGRSNWKNLSFNIPFFDWNSLKNFQVSVHGIKRLPNQPDVYLDSAWLSVTYEQNKDQVSNTNYVKPNDSGLSFKSNDFKKEQNPSFKVFEDFTSISCDIKPFTIFAKKGDSANFKVNLVKTNRDMPYRLSIGDTPDLVLPRLIISNENGEDKVEILVDISAGAKSGSYSMVLLYEGLINKSIFASDDKYETTYCRFNLTIL